MTYRSVYCEYCKAYLGDVHNYEWKSLLHEHFKNHHIEELKEMEEASRVLRNLKRKYSYRGLIILKR